MAALCDEVRQADSVAIDTEFVSEFTYRPVLCLVQVELAGRLIVIDPLAVGEMRPFWEAIAAEGRQVIVHAGREELVFCLESIGRQPDDLFDVQIAAGFLGLEYPGGYGNLCYRVLDATPRKGETRTDWRRRPLSPEQIDYALDDVRYLRPMRDKLHGRLAELGRVSWLVDETNAWKAEIEASRGGDRWYRLVGGRGMNGQTLSIIRELWEWREGEAERRNQPMRRILRDDLIVELAKRRSADPRQIKALRGMERRDLAPLVSQIARRIETALSLAKSDWPAGLPLRREPSQQVGMVAQFLSSALTSLCSEAEIAPALVGTASDVRDFVMHRLAGSGEAERELPSLCRGWRAEVVGQILDDLLSGRRSIRIADPTSDKPLSFDLVSREKA